MNIETESLFKRRGGGRKPGSHQRKFTSKDPIITEPPAPRMCIRAGCKRIFTPGEDNENQESCTECLQVRAVPIL